jgi:hypothetical protein
MIDGLTEGRIVHYVMAGQDAPSAGHQSVGQHRPATIVRTWDKESGCSNLIVFLDGSNDGHKYKVEHMGVAHDEYRHTYWATSRMYSEGGEPGTWHWPERTAAPAPVVDNDPEEIEEPAPVIVEAEELVPVAEVVGSVDPAEFEGRGIEDSED